MSIAAASAQLLEVDGAERARAGALASCASSPLPPPAYQLRARPAWVREGGMRWAGAGDGECVYIGVWRGKLG